MRPHRATLILVLGILSFLGCGIFTAIPAWIMGNADLKDMDAGVMDPSGRGMTSAGKVLGMIACILTIVGFAIVIAMLLLGFGLFGISLHQQQ